MAKKIKGGFLIAIEGIDGAGKTTQVNLLKRELESKGFSVVTFKEPTNSKFGEIIRKVAMHNNMHFGRNAYKENTLFINDRKLDVKKNIKPNLKKGNIVIMDRYFYSNMAYQGVLGVDEKKIMEENIIIAPIPDVTFILDVEPENGIERIMYKRMENTNDFEKKEYLEKVRTKFNNMRNYPNVRIVSGEKSVEDVTKVLLNGIMELILKKINKENETLRRTQRLIQIACVLLIDYHITSLRMVE